ncbi:MAG TPA: universal stress protein [Deltaproteobacteria bacterium]|nr:universal stress protein [Deltaproteobacteria bacterium]
MKIMVGFDGTDIARGVLKLAEDHAKAFNAQIFVVTAVTQSHDVKLDDMDRMEESDRQLNEIKNHFEKADIPCEVRVLVNDLQPGESLVQFANENAIDEIVIGVKKRSKVGKLLFGSTAQYVILEAKCPVVAAK